MGLLERLQSEAKAAGLGVAQGVGFGWADEASLFGSPDDYAAARRDYAGSMMGGEMLGSLLWAALGAKALRGNKNRFRTAAAAGAAHGALAGSGAGERGLDATLEDRLAGAGLGAGVGGAVGALMPTAVKVGGDIADNLPAMIGRRRVYNPDGPDFSQWARPGQGTRLTAPLEARLAGSGSPSERAQAALAAALAQDESAAMRAGRQVIGRQGEEIIPWQSGAGEASVRSLVDYAARSPGGQSMLGRLADEMVAQRLAAQAKRLSPPTGARIGGAKTRATVQDLVDFADQPQAHKSWLSEVRRLAAPQRAAVGAALVRKAKADPQNLADPQFLEKLAAAGARSRPGANAARGRGRGAAPVADETALRQRMANTDSPAFVNSNDGGLALQARLSDEDAAALLMEAMRARRAYAVRPDAQAAALEGLYRPGMRFRPNSYFGGVTDDQLERAVFLSQPAAVAAHGAPYLFGE